MTITYDGKLSAAVAIPVLAQAVASLDIPGLQGQVTGLLKITATFKPPSIAGTLAFAAKLAAAAEVAIVSPAVSILGSLEAKLALLQIRLQLALAIKDLLVSGSFRVYEYEGTAGTFGSELTTTLAGADADGGIAAGQSTYAVLLVAEGGTAGATTLRVIRHGVP